MLGREEGRGKFPHLKNKSACTAYSHPPQGSSPDWLPDSRQQVYTPGEEAGCFPPPKMYGLREKTYR